MRSGSIIALGLLATAVLPSSTAAQDGRPQCDGSDPLVLRPDAGTETEVLAYPGKVYLMVNNRFSVCTAPSAVTIVGAPGRNTVILGFAGLEIPVTFSGADGADALNVNNALAESRLAEPPGTSPGEVPPLQPGTGVVRFEGGAGDDLADGRLRRLTADLGNGDDAASVDAMSGLQLATGSGRDEVLAVGTRGSIGPWAIDLGPGDDSAKLNLRSAPSSPDWTVQGSAGNDVLDVARGRVDCGAGSKDFLSRQLTTGSVRAIHSSSCPPLLLRRDDKATATPADGPRRIVLRGLRATRRAVATLSVSTDPARGRRPVRLTAVRRFSIGPRATQVALPLSATGQRVTRGHARMRVQITLHALRGVTGGDRLRNVISAAATLRRR